MWPGVKKDIQQKLWADADSESVRVSLVLEGETALINAAAGEPEHGGR